MNEIEATEKFRKCNRCEKTLPIENFSKSPHSRGGYNAICKECVSKRIKAAQRQKRLSATSINLCDISDNEIVAELRKRGFTGELKYERAVKV